MKIGELAEQSATPVPTIRYYEGEGLIPEAPRSASNYRIYEPVHVQRLCFIRRCRELDLSLDEIRQLLLVVDDPQAECAGVDSVVDAHIDHVRHRLVELTRLEQDLRQLRANCDASGATGDCGILSELDAPPLPAERAKRSSGASGPHISGDLHRS